MKRQLKYICLMTLIYGILLQHGTAQNKVSKEDIRNKTTNELIKDFVSDDWLGRVVPAEKELETRPSETIPEIIKLLDKHENLKLENTADLIYPGAKMFYGH